MIRKVTAVLILLLLAINSQAESVCTRAELQSAVDSYLQAQSKGEISAMVLAADASFLENMIEVSSADGLWNTALPIAFSRSFLDSTRCRTFSEIIVTEGGHKYVIGTRLYVNDSKITRIDSLVTDKGDWLFNADAYLKFSSAEDWSAPPESQRTAAADLINAANNYFDFFSDRHVAAPWGRPCARLEGGAYTNADNDPNPSCQVGEPQGFLYIVNRDYVVDEEMGVINVFCRFGNSTSGMPDSHTIRMIDGKIHQVHTLSVNLNPDRPSPQATAEGRIAR